MTNEEFIKIYNEGNDDQVREAIVEMNKNSTFIELSRILCVSYSRFRKKAGGLGLVGNKALAKSRKFLR